MQAQIACMAGRTLVFAAMAALLALGCQPSGEPLYPHPEIPRRADEVASITGPIAFIDERPVSSRGTVFQVLPGCHVVRLLDRIGEMNAEGTAGWSAHLPPLVFLFRTRGGFSYGIDVRGRSGSGLYGELSVAASERAPDGTITAVPPSRDAGEVQACLQGTSGNVAPPSTGSTPPAPVKVAPSSVGNAS